MYAVLVPRRAAAVEAMHVRLVPDQNDLLLKMARAPSLYCGEECVCYLTVLWYMVGTDSLDILWCAGELQILESTL